MTQTAEVEHRNVSGRLRTAEEKALVVRAAEHADESISTFVRRAVLARAVKIARTLPEPTENETEDREEAHAHG